MKIALHRTVVKNISYILIKKKKTVKKSGTEATTAQLFPFVLTLTFVNLSIKEIPPH